MKRDKASYFKILIIGFGIILLILIIYPIFELTVMCGIKEKNIAKRFSKEMETTEGLIVENFDTYDCDGWANVQIEGKGKALIFYDENGNVSVRGITSYPTSFVCYYVDSNEKPTRYAGNFVLWLDKDSPYEKWFPFEINNLQDLVLRYDDIVDSMEKLPKNPELVDFEDRFEKRNVLKNYDENFRLYWKASPYWFDHFNILKKDVACDLYILDR